MKTQSNNLFETLNSDDLKVLTSEVKETICKDFTNKRKRIFSLAEYWDMQRRRRNLLARRMAF